MPLTPLPCPRIGFNTAKELTREHGQGPINGTADPDGRPRALEFLSSGRTPTDPSILSHALTERSSRALLEELLDNFSVNFIKAGVACEEKAEARTTDLRANGGRTLLPRDNRALNFDRFGFTIEMGNRVCS